MLERLSFGDSVFGELAILGGSISIIEAADGSVFEVIVGMTGSINLVGL